MIRKNGNALAIRNAINKVASTKGDKAYACLMKIALVLNKNAAAIAQLAPMECGRSVFDIIFKLPEGFKSQKTS